MTAADSLRSLLTPVEPIYELPLHTGWERMPTTDQRLSVRLSRVDSRMAGRLLATLRADSVASVWLPDRQAGPLAIPILERRVRGEKFGTLDPLAAERIAHGAEATLGDPAILRHRGIETSGDGDRGDILRYLLVTPGSERRRGVEFVVALPVLEPAKLRLLETLYDGIVATGSWRLPPATA